MSSPPVPCLLCRNPNTVVIRHGIREDKATPVYRCGKCRLRFIEPAYADARAYYQSQYRQTHGPINGHQTTPADRYLSYRPHVAPQVAFLKERVPLGGMVLEIGCSSGYFLDAIKGDYAAFGNEWNPDDAAYVRDTLGLPCEDGDIDEVYPGKSFTAICAFHVLEHQPDPLQWLLKVKKRLIGGGWLYLELPHGNEALVSVYDIPEFRDWYYRDAHITYWEMETVANLMAVCGFDVEVTLRQRYGLLNHLNWIQNRKPMATYEDGTKPMSLVTQRHPAAGVFNRWFSRIDREYRLQLETLKAADTIKAIGRRQEI